MKTQLQLLSFFLLFNFTYSQENESEVHKLASLKILKKTFCLYNGKWSQIYELNNGLPTLRKNYFHNKLTSLQKNIYDDNSNLIYEISLYNINTGNKIDTTSRIKYEYDHKNRIIEKIFDFGLVEKFSEFDKNSKPTIIQRSNENGEPLYFFPITENREYDSIGNLIKETLVELEYPLDANSEQKFRREINTYQYDQFGNVIYLKREFSPQVEFPVIMTGGLPLYEVEKFEYKYNKKGLWTKKYWIVEGKKRLRETRKFK